MSNRKDHYPPNPNEFILLSFDTGGAATGWAMFHVGVQGFATSKAKILRHLSYWNCGELSGTETEILDAAVWLIDQCVLRARRNNRTQYPTPGLHVLTEDFDLTQTIGDKENLLSPVRQNAVLAWECHKRGIQLKYQARNLRMSVTRERLELMDFEGPFKKDEFAAMQHGVVHLRKLKRQSISNPWKVR